MNTLKPFFKAHGIFSIILVAFLIVVPLVLFFSNGTTRTNNQTVALSPTPKPSPQVIKKALLPAGNTEYTYTSSLKDRPDLTIVNQQGKTVFKRDVLAPTDKTTVSDTLTTLGEYDEAIIGSHYYGPNAVTIIYATKGITVISVPGNKLKEVQTYTPTTLANYKKLYGDDLNESKDSD